MNSLPDFRLLQPTTAAEAVALAAAHAGSRFVAGGTDLLPNLRRGLVRSEVLIDLTQAADLKAIRDDGDALTIGAGVPLAMIATDGRIAARLPALAQAAGAVAGPTHRVAATLGGNLCLDTRCKFYNQSERWRESIHYCMKLDGDACRVAKKSKRCFAAYSGDVAPALIALGAEVEVLSPAGSRRLPLADLYRDDGMAWLTLAADELLAAVTVPTPAGWRSGYEKMRVRGAIDFPLAGVAVALRRDGETVGDLRVALTGVTSRPLAVDLADCAGQAFDAARATLLDRVGFAAGAMHTTLVEPLYRRDVASVLARRLLTRLWADA